jgi:hypothetical protein
MRVFSKLDIFSEWHEHNLVIRSLREESIDSFSPKAVALAGDQALVVLAGDLPQR